MLGRLGGVRVLGAGRSPDVLLPGVRGGGSPATVSGCASTAGAVGALDATMRLPTKGLQPYFDRENPNGRRARIRRSNAALSLSECSRASSHIRLRASGLSTSRYPRFDDEPGLEVLRSIDSSSPKVRLADYRRSRRDSIPSPLRTLAAPTASRSAMSPTKYLSVSLNAFRAGVSTASNPYRLFAS